MRLVNLFLEFLFAGLCLFMAHTAQATMPLSFQNHVGLNTRLEMVLQPAIREPLSPTKHELFKDLVPPG